MPSRRLIIAHWSHLARDTESERIIAWVHAAGCGSPAPNLPHSLTRPKCTIPRVRRSIRFEHGLTYITGRHSCRVAYVGAIIGTKLTCLYPVPRGRRGGGRGPRHPLSSLPFSPFLRSSWLSHRPHAFLTARLQFIAPYRARRERIIWIFLPQPLVKKLAVSARVKYTRRVVHDTVALPTPEWGEIRAPSYVIL